MADETAQARQRVADARRAWVRARYARIEHARCARLPGQDQAPSRSRPLACSAGSRSWSWAGRSESPKQRSVASSPSAHNRPPTLLPKEVDKTLKSLPEEDREQIRAHLERDFAAYLKKEHVADASTGRQSFWKTYDMLVGIVGGAAAKELVKKALAVPAEARVEQAKEDAKAAEEIAASGGAAHASPERAAKP